jgi:hypothetical protein
MSAGMLWDIFCKKIDLLLALNDSDASESFFKEVILGGCLMPLLSRLLLEKLLLLRFTFMFLIF